MIRKILLTLIAICCAAQTWAMVSPDGEQILPESSEVQMGDRTEPDYLTITATSDNTRIYLIVHGSPNLSTFQYSYNDGVTWTNITKTTTFNTLQDGQCIKFRSSNQVTKNDVDYINFADNRNCSYKVSGNINTLINYNAVENVCIGDSCFYSLFYGCKGLTDASELSLPAYSLTDWCYYFMFKGCTNLTAAPELPADILADCCYAGMFSYCQSLCTAPVLHATNLAPACYGAMFMGCISLIEAPVLPATTLAEECYSSMFYDCISLIEAPALPATILAEECYASMFYRCTSLTEAPVLPAATLAKGCYYSMFSGCTSLTEAPALIATTLSTMCYYRMFSGCTSLTEAPALPATTLTIQCYEDMFWGCTSLTEAPVLPATTLASRCYIMMFENCTSLTSVTTHATTWNTSDAAGWLWGVATTGDFYNLGGADIPTGTSGIPTGWTEHGPRVKTITAVPNDENYGTVSGGGSYLINETCTLSATPNTGYTFVNWTENDEIVSTDAEYSFTVENDRNLVANFDVNADYLTFTALENNTIIGLDVIGSPNISTLQYSYDGKNWNNITETMMFNTLQTGEYIKFRSENQVSNSYDNYIRFKDNMMSGAYIVSGNINTLINYLDVDNAVIGVDAFIYLFISCSHLTNATSLSLPATTLAWGCYKEMFGHCTSLTEAPELPATTLAGNCYDAMFFGCTSLSEAPELPATTLNVFCYSDMFRDCISLTEAPELPATTLAYECYNNMFSGCTSLNSVTTHATTWNYNNTLYWLSGVSATGDFYNLGGADIPTGISGIPTGWTVHNPTPITITASANNSDFGIVSGGGTFAYGAVATVTATPNSDYTFVKWTENDEIVSTDAEYSFTVETDRNLVAIFVATMDYLTLTALEDNTIIGLEVIGSPNISTLQYSYDGENWNNITNSLTFNTLQNGQYIKFRSENQVSYDIDDNYINFNYINFRDESGSYKVSGNINTLVNYVNVDNVVLADYAFHNLFYGCLGLTDASELLLPCNFLAEDCYSGMFTECSSLIHAPVLPATTLAEGCYGHMFEGCSSLTTAPELPATTLATYCYSEMFQGCTSLTTAPELPATTLADYCYVSMFFFCESLTDAPELPATTLTKGCYASMFRDCRLLTEAPELPATTLTDGCYASMFSGCSSLTEAPELPATMLTPECYFEMFSGCSSLTETPELPATTLAGWCYGSMFFFCESLTDAPQLPATTLTDGCYTSMFKDCRSLTEAPALPATTLTEQCYASMFSGCSSLTEVPELPATTLTPECYFEMFSGCSSLTETPELPATALANGCYNGMFSGCTSLAEAPELPATALANGCYSSMFYGCTSLVTAPELPAANLDEGCYWYMFSGCTSLSSAPELSAPTLADYCYYFMFQGCTSLTETPELPATTLAEYCYEGMFYGCTSLNEAPELPATALANLCYKYMFSGCTSLNSVTTHAMTWNTEYAQGWLSGVSSTGDFYNLGGADIPTGTSGIPEGWTEHNPNLKTITAVPNDENYGTVTGNGSYLINETCTLSATPNSGYTFVNWTENDIEVSTDAEYSFTVENDRNLVANFEASSSGNHWNPNPYLYADNMNVVAEIYIDNVLQTSSDIEIGAFCNEEVRGSGRVEYEGVPFNKYIVNLTIHGVADDNITFRVFNHQTNEEVSCRIGQSLTFTPNQIEGNLINPYAIECFTTADIVTTVNPSVGGTVSGDGTYQVGQTVTLTATASDYYRFVNWTENDEEVSTSESYSFTAYDDRSLVANFEIYSHWVPDPSLYTYSMTIITEIQVDGMTRTSGILRIGGREQDYNEIEVGAFCGDEIRGSAMLTYMPEPIDKFMVSIVVYGEENDNIAFRLYNHETATEYNLNAPEPIPFVPNATLGSFDEPYVLNFLSTVNISASTNPVEAGTITGIGDYAIGSEATLTAVPNDGFAFKNWTNNGVVVSTETSYSFTADDDGVLVANFDYLQSKELAAGWNWYSTYVAVSGEEGFNMLTANLGTSADVIKSQTNMSMYYDEYNVWSGSLTTIDNMQMYMIKMNTSDELEIVGGLADLAGTQLTLHPGWNWISFPSNVETSLTDALAGFTPDDGDCIKSQFNMALYYGGEYNVWNGSLNKLTPGQGFMYKNNSSSIKVLTYSTAGSKYITDVNITTDGNHWQPNIHAYPDNINITAVVSVNGTEQASENMEVGVFSGGECRGSGRLVYNEMAGRYVTYLTVYGNEGDNLSFRLYDASKDEEYQDAADCSLTFEPNLILGDLRNPFAINFGYDVVFQDDMASFSVYPNPAKVNSVIRLGENCDDVKVINSLGVVVKGYTNTDRIEGFDLAGIYYLVITKGNSIVYSKIIVE